VINRVISNSFPCDGPAMTQSFLRSSAESTGFAVSGNGDPDNPIGLGLSRVNDEGTLTVGGPAFEGTFSIIE